MPQRIPPPVQTCLLALALLLTLIVPTCASAQASPAALDLAAARESVTDISSTAWRFHPGDDPGWASPSLNDTAWSQLTPSRNWKAQGYADLKGFSWFRVHLLVPPHTTSLAVQLPRFDRNYQFFGNGLLIAQVGALPPQHGSIITATARVFTIPLHGSASPQPLVLALRMWQDPQFAQFRGNVLVGRALAGSPHAILQEFAAGKAVALLNRGSRYTLTIVSLIGSVASLMLFLFTRERLYLWFGVFTLISVLDLPTRLLSQHYAWPFEISTFLYLFYDLGEVFTLGVFVLLALGVQSRRLPAFFFTCITLAELGPALVLLHLLPSTAADFPYFFFNTLGQVVLFGYLIRGWRQASLDARLLLIPYVADFLVSTAGNLGHFLDDVKIAWANKLYFGNISLLTAPFLVTVANVVEALSLLSFLAVLVYRYARTSREQQRLASALHAAHNVQHRLVAVDVPRLGTLHTEVAYLAAEEVGGDFCQVLPREDGSVLIAIGDVSGKGLEAAMLGTLLVGALRSMAGDSSQPAEILCRLNQVLLRTERSGFTTCLCLLLSPSGLVHFANAGHLSPYLNGEEVSTESGLPLGLIEEAEYDQQTLLLPDGARLTLISDGVVEARSHSGELFGFDRTLTLSRLPAPELAAAAHRHGQQDDITILTLDWHAPQPAASAQHSGPAMAV